MKMMLEIEKKGEKVHVHLHQTGMTKKGVLALS